MNPEERSHSQALLEDLETRLCVLGEGHAAHAEVIAANKAELKQEIAQVDRRLIEVDVRLMQRIDKVDIAVHAKLGVLDQRIGALERQHEALGPRTGALERQVGALDQRIGGVERQHEALGPWTAALERQVRALDQQDDALDRKLELLDTKLSTELARIAAHLGIGVPPARE